MPEWLTDPSQLVLIAIVMGGTPLVGMLRREPWWVIAMTTVGNTATWVALIWALSLSREAPLALLLGVIGAYLVTTAYERHRAGGRAAKVGT